MKVVERYIMRRAFTLFVGALAWTMAIVWTTQVLARIDLVTDNGQSALVFFEVATLILPSVLTIVVPFALILAVAQTLSAMNSDSELVVINAAGASRLAVIRPILLLAVGASILCFVVQNGVDPYARQRNRELVADSRADFLSVIIQEGTFRKVDDGLFVQIGERFPDNRLGQVFVADSRQEGVDLVYYAKTGAIVEREGEKVLVMNDGVVHRKTPSGDVSVISFTSYAFDLSAFDDDVSGVRLLPKDQTTQYLLNPSPNDSISKKSPNLYRTELAKRFSEWLLPLAFAFIALAVAGDARSHREARVNPLITAVSIALIVRWICFFAEGRARVQPSFIYVMYLAPIAISLVAIWFIRTHRTMSLPVSWAERLTAITRRIAAVLASIRQRIFGGPAPTGAA